MNVRQVLAGNLAPVLVDFPAEDLMIAGIPEIIEIVIEITGAHVIQAETGIGIETNGKLNMGSQLITVLCRYIIGL